MDSHTPPIEPADPTGFRPPEPNPDESGPAEAAPEQASFALTLGEQTPPVLHRPPQRRQPPSPPAPPPPETPAISVNMLDPLLEHLAREVSGIVSAAKEEIREAAEKAAARMITKFAAQLDARAKAVEAHMAEVALQAAELVQKVDELLRASVAVSEDNGSLLSETRDAMVTKLENVIKRTEDQVKVVVERGEAQWKKIEEDAQALMEELRRNSHRLGWKPWAMATALALSTIIMTTLLRPGWTMSGEQRRALRVGEAVIYTYSSAPEAERKEMRRVMRWRTPENPDSVEAPPVPSRP